MHKQCDGKRAREAEGEGHRQERTVQASERVRERESLLCEGQMLICCFCCLMSVCWRIESHRAAAERRLMNESDAFYTSLEARSVGKDVTATNQFEAFPYSSICVYIMPCGLEDRHSYIHTYIHTPRVLLLLIRQRLVERVIIQ